MAQTNLCPLCVNPCSGPKSLYDANGVGNWVYQVTAKYFQSVFSNAAEKRGTQFSNICSKCWRYIVDYHTFEQSIFGAQAKALPAPEHVCRLCVCSYRGDQCKRIFNNPDNDVYRITFKYMHSVFSNPDGQNLGAICLKCWDLVQTFHKFQTDVYESQKMLPRDEDKMEDEIVIQTVNEICASQTTEEHVSRNTKCHAKDSEFSIYDNAVQVTSELQDLWNYETLDQSKLLANEMSNNEPLFDSAADQMSTKEIPSGFKDDDYYQDSISLPKLEKIDIHSEYDSNEENLSDEISGEDKESDGRLNSKKGKAQIKRNGRSAPKYHDDLIAQWKPNLECVMCYGLFTRFTFLLKHFQRQHPKCDFYILCCQCKLVNHQMIVEHAKIHLDSEVYTSNICGNPLNSRPSYNAHKSKQHFHNNHDKNETNKKTTTELASAKSHRELNTFLAKWWPVLDNDIQVKSEPIDLLQYKTMDQSKLFENNIFRNKTPDKPVRGEPEVNNNVKYQNSTEEIPNDVKYANYYQDSISLPKLEIMDVPSDTDSNQVNLSGKISDEKKGADCQPKAYSESYTCNICGKSFNIRNSYTAHNRRKHSNNAKPAKSYKEFDAFLAQWRTSLKCELCDKSALGFTELKQHFRRKHPRVKCFITCCERKLKYRYQISEHIVIHMDPNTYKCEMCDKCYNSKYSLRHHEKISHFNTNDKKSTQDEDKILNEDN